MKLHNERLHSVYSGVDIIEGNKIKWNELGEVCTMHGKEYKYV